MFLGNVRQYAFYPSVVNNWGPVHFKHSGGSVSLFLLFYVFPTNNLIRPRQDSTSALKSSNRNNCVVMLLVYIARFNYIFYCNFKAKTLYICYDFYVMSNAICNRKCLSVLPHVCIKCAHGLYYAFHNKLRYLPMYQYLCLRNICFFLFRISHTAG